MSSTLRRMAIISVLGVATLGGGYFAVSQYGDRVRDEVQKEQVIRDYEGQQRIQERANRAPRSTGTDAAVARMREYLENQ